VLLEKVIFAELVKKFLAFHGKGRSFIGFLIRSIYKRSLTVRFYFHTSRRERNELTDDIKFKQQATVKGSLPATTAHYFKTAETNLPSNTTFLTFIFRGLQIFQKSSRQLKILGPRRVAGSKFYTEYPQILGTTVQNLVAPTAWPDKYVNPCPLWC
jgi:hypothetical protein